MKVNELRILIQEIIAEEGERNLIPLTTSNELPKTFIKDKLNDILFKSGKLGYGYLYTITYKNSEVRKKRIELVVKQLNDYITLLKSYVRDGEEAGFEIDEETFVQATTNEGFFGPSKKDIADFEAELEALIKEKGLENAPNLEKMKTDVRAIAKTSSFKGGKLGYQAAGISKRTGNKIAPQFYYSTDSTTTGR
jgi:hypothetical protein